MSLLKDLIKALEDDQELKFNKLDANGYMQEGICPKCGKRELWTYRDSPWVLFCGRKTHCGDTFHVRERYKHLFENFTERFPATEDDPNASARAYLRDNRGFNTGLLAGWYSQEQMRLEDGSTEQSIRFKINEDCYWARLIDAKAIRRNKGKKAKIVGSYKGECWQPPKQIINDGDKVWITEGIFKSIALLESKFEKEDMKTVSALSANNLPIEFIKRNADRNITWIIALDNDHAGISSSIKFKEQIKELKERVLIAIPAGKPDWDDEFRLKRLNDKYFKDALWRGQYLTATTAKEKAFWLYVKTGFNHTVIEQNHQIWRSTLRDKKDTNAMSEFKERYHENKEPLYTDPLHDVAMAIKLFELDYSTVAISNCLPRFLYTEINPQTDEKHYFFKVTFPNRKGQYLAGLSASDLDSPANFKRSLLSKVTGARIRPAPTDLDILQEHWFDHGTGPEEIRTIPFVGYDHETEAYAFPDFGYHNGKMVEKNKEGYLAFNKVSIKSGLKQLGSIVYHTGRREFNPGWYSDFYYIWGNKGLATLAWWTGSLFAQQIRKRQEGFPILEVSGDRETGKSSMTKHLWRLLGLSKYEGVDPGKLNEKALARKFAQSSNLPLVMTEGDRSETKGRSMFDYDWLKTTWEGGVIRGTGIKNHGLETNEEDFKGSTMIVQNLSVDGSDALLSRIVHIHMEATGYSAEIEKRIANLRSMDVEELTAFRNEVLTRESELLETYFKEYDTTHEELVNRANKQEEKFTPRVLQNHAQILAWAHTLQTIFGKELINDLQLRHFKSYLWDRCRDRQRRLQSEHELLQQFWEYYETLNYERSMAAGKEAIIEKLNHLTGTGKIAVNLPEFDSACGENKMQRLDMSELKKLFPNSHTHKFLEQKKVRSKIPTAKKPTYRCWVFEEAASA